MTLRLRQLQVIHRHGDRTPLSNIFKGSINPRSEEEETFLWNLKLPAPTQLCFKFRVETSGDAQRSLQQRPFGYLTAHGIEQMRKRGHQLVRYDASYC